MKKTNEKNFYTCSFSGYPYPGDFCRARGWWVAKLARRTAQGNY